MAHAYCGGERHSATNTDIDINRLYIQYSEHPLAQANRDQSLTSILDVVHLLVIILGQYLDMGAGSINTYGNNWGHSPYLQTRLLQAGWCRSVTGMEGAERQEMALF